MEVRKLLVAYLACFALGRSGIGGFLPPFNSTAPGTVSYLIFQAEGGPPSHVGFGSSWGSPGAFFVFWLVFLCARVNWATG